MRFTGKVAVITAFANGIGRATAEIMAREGAVVVGVDNHPGRLEEAMAALRRLPKTFCWSKSKAVCDLTVMRAV